MKKKLSMKRCLAVLLALLSIIAMVPLTVSAADQYEEVDFTSSLPGAEFGEYTYTGTNVDVYVGYHRLHSYEWRVYSQPEASPQRKRSKYRLLYSKSSGRNRRDRV